METLRLTVEQIELAAEILNNGGVVAFPTDTVYGLAVRSDMPLAIQHMKDAKQRPESKPFPMMVNSLQQIEQVAKLKQRDYRLIKRWMPGAVTFVFKKKDDLDPIVTNGFKTIGIRMPDDPFILKLISLIGVPLLVPSANLSGYPSTTDSDEVLAQLDGKIEAVIVGESGGKTSSTVIDATAKELILLRQGEVMIEDVRKSLKEKETTT